MWKRKEFIIIMSFYKIFMLRMYVEIMSKRNLKITAETKPNNLNTGACLSAIFMQKAQHSTSTSA